MGILLVYDVTNETSFTNISKWLHKIEEHANEDVERMLVGNKCDLEDNRKISAERGEQLAKSHQIRFLEMSAMTNTNVERAFRILTEDILNKVCPPVKEEPTKKGKKKRGLGLKNESSSRKGCC